MNVSPWLKFTKTPAHRMIINPFVFGGGGGGFVPTDVAGCVLWLPADYLGLGDNDPVSTWTDYSTSLNNASQSSASLKPTYKTGVVNGMPVVRFDGTNDYMDGGNIGLAQPFTLFMVFSITSAVANQLGNIFDTYSPNKVSVAFNSFGTGVIHVYASTYRCNQVYVAGITGFIVYRAEYNGASSLSAVNGGMPVTGSPGSNSAGVYILGKSEGGVYISLDLAELALYNSILGTSDIDQVENYLGTKYGITIL